MRLLPLPRTGNGRRLLWTLLAFAAATLGLPAQSVRWEAGDSGLGNSLLLIFENCEPEGQPALPSIPGVTFAPAGRSESTNIVNFSVSRTIALSYVVRGPQNPPLQIPTFTVRTSKGDLPVAAFNVAAPAAPLDSLARARLLPARPSAWAGEVFGLTYELSAARRPNPPISPTSDWTPWIPCCAAGNTGPWWCPGNPANRPSCPEWPAPIRKSACLTSTRGNRSVPNK